MSSDYEPFLQTLWGHYDKNKRDLPWRNGEGVHGFDPYHILVSEFMLQQTQVNRVIQKYEEFTKIFPTISSLAEAPLSRVMELWVGLGYNRRAKYLHDAAKQLHKRPFPREIEALTTLKGLGHNTAAAVLVYSFNIPIVFVETNIRSVYLHHFFSEGTSISDKEILELVDLTLDKQNAREFYWALMDYGTFLKKNRQGAIQKSAHYKKQSRFEGSQRQIRGEVVRLLTCKNYTIDELKTIIVDSRLESVIAQLTSEGLIRRKEDFLLID